MCCVLILYTCQTIKMETLFKNLSPFYNIILFIGYRVSTNTLDTLFFSNFSAFKAHWIKLMSIFVKPTKFCFKKCHTFLKLTNN